MTDLPQRHDTHAPHQTHDQPVRDSPQHVHGLNDEHQLIGLLLALTVVTGMVDAVSYLGLGRVFTANMTGNIVLLGFAATGAPHLSFLRSLASVVAFLAGGIVGGRVASAFAPRRRRWIVTVGTLEALLLLGAAAAATGMAVDAQNLPDRLFPVIILTAFAMGLRMATTRRLAVPDISTTVLTTTLAGLAADSTFAGGSNPRFGRRAASVLAMALGAAIGAILLRSGLALTLAVSGACVLAANVAYAAIETSAA